MDNFHLMAQNKATECMVVKLDAEAARMLLDLQLKSNADKKYIVSEMIKFCYPRTVIETREIKIQEECENERN